MRRSRVEALRFNGAQSSIQAVQEAIATTSIRRAEFLAAIAGV